jgi:hypothetical protein
MLGHIEGALLGKGSHGSDGIRIESSRGQMHPEPHNCVMNLKFRIELAALL